MPSEVFAVNQLYLKGVAVLTLAFMQQIRLQVSQQQKKFSPDVWRRAINAHLPNDVVVLRSSEADPSFNPITDAEKKRYRYRIHDGEVRPVLARPFVWQWNSRLSVSAMQNAASFLIGEHDFSSFENPSSPRASKVRTIHDITIQRYTGGEYEADNEVWIEIEGNGFLYNMVRIIVGTLLMVGSGKRPEIWPAECSPTNSEHPQAQLHQPTAFYFYKSPSNHNWQPLFMPRPPEQLGSLRLVRQLGVGRKCQIWEASDESQSNALLSNWRLLSSPPTRTSVNS